MTTTLTVTAKGQVTLRKELLDHLGVRPGDRIAVDLLPSGRAQVRAARAPSSIERFIGHLDRPGRHTVSLADMQQIIADGWAGKS